MMLEQRCENLTQALIEVDYLLSYGKVFEARTLIETLIEDQQLNNQKGIKNANT